MSEIKLESTPVIDFTAVKCISGNDRISADYPNYLLDESRLSPQPIEFLFFPRTETELAAVLREMNMRRIPVTIAGARTGLVGGSVPQAGALISLECLDQVEDIQFDASNQEWRISAQAGLSLTNLEAMLRTKQFPSLAQSNDEATRSAYQKFMEDANQYFYPPDPTEMGASLGGSVATNASGARTFRYGPTREWVRGMRVFYASGEHLDISRGQYFASEDGKFKLTDSQGKKIEIEIPGYTFPDTKCAAGFFSAPGMDLIDLFIGSEGVLGVVSRVTVALLKKEGKISIVQFVDSDEQAIQLTLALRASQNLKFDFLEFYSGNALELLRQLQKESPSLVGMPPIAQDAGAAIFLELAFDSQSQFDAAGELQKLIVDCGGDPVRSWAGYEPRELDRFKVFRHLVPETINGIIAERKKGNPDLHKLGTDMAVPDQHLVEMWHLYKTSCEQAGLEWAAFGHIGNNHIHVNILPRDQHELEKGLSLFEVFARKTVEFGGAVSAEHGIGKIKKKFLRVMYSTEHIQQMKRIKDALDPSGILNPEVIF